MVVALSDPFTVLLPPISGQGDTGEQPGSTPPEAAAVTPERAAPRRRVTRAY
jgi:hypothetical protein